MFQFKDPSPDQFSLFVVCNQEPIVEAEIYYEYPNASPEQFPRFNHERSRLSCVIPVELTVFFIDAHQPAIYALGSLSTRDELAKVATCTES